MEELKKRFEQLLRAYDRLEYMRKTFLRALQEAVAYRKIQCRSKLSPQSLSGML